MQNVTIPMHTVERLWALGALASGGGLLFFLPRILILKARFEKGQLVLKLLGPESRDASGKLAMAITSKTIQDYGSCVVCLFSVCISCL